MFSEELSESHSPMEDLSATHLISRGGEMGERIRAFDWSSTCLGSITQWPQSLVTTVNILLQSPVPLVMLWGPDGIMLYNDAYSAFAGARHPSLLGSKVLEGWPEVADFNRHVMATGLKGETLSYQGHKLTLYRNNIAEDVYMDLNYSPIIGENGKPAGILAIVVETTQRVKAEKEREQAVEALKISESRFRSMANSAPVMIWMSNEQGDVTYRNQAFMHFYGVSETTAQESFVWERHVHPDDLGWVQEVFGGAVKSEKAFDMPEHRIRRFDGQYRWLIGNGVPKISPDGIFQGFIGSVVDITERKRFEAIWDGQRKALEKAMNGEPLPVLLEAIARNLEEQSEDGTLVSILLVDSDGRRLKHGAAPNLPESYINALRGLEMGPSVGSCGTAAFRQEEVIVPDIEAEPLWADYKDLALSYGLRSCWSSPIFSSRGQLLGTFAIYHKTRYMPSPADREVLELLTRTAAMVIERHEGMQERQQAQEMLQESEARFRLMADAAPNFVWTLGADGGQTYLNQYGLKFFEVTLETFLQNSWPPYLHPDDIQPAWQALKDAMKTKSSYRFEHRVKRSDGEYRWVLSCADPSILPNGDLYGYVGSSIDITERKQAEMETRIFNNLLSALSRIQQEFIAGNDSWALWEGCVSDLLELTDSQYGYVGEVLYTEDGRPYLKFLGLTNIAWSPETQALFEGLKTRGLEFHNLENLFGVGVKGDGSLVISNNPEQDPRSGGRPPGHLPLSAFMGLPIYGKDGKLVGQVGLANAPKGYSETDAEYLQPLLITCGNMIEAYRNIRLRETAEFALKESEERYQTLYKWEKKTREILQEIRQPLDIQAIYTTMVTAVAKALSVDRCFIVEFDDEGRVLPVQYEYCCHEDMDSLLGICPPWELCPYLPLSARNQLSYSQDCLDDGQVDMVPEWQEFARRYAIHGLMTIPGMYQNKLSNILVLHTTAPRQWDEQERFFIKTVTDQLSVSFYQAKAQEQLVKASDMKTQFVSNMSHELRTPLNSIIGYTQMLEGGIAGQLNTKQQKYAKNVLMSSKHLLELVNDVLDLAKVESGKFELNLESFEVAALVEEVAVMFGEMADNQKVTLTFQPAPDIRTLVADRARIKQILINLISNAIKFNRENGIVDVHIFNSPDNQWVLFEIRDTGIGIPKSKISQLFSEFFQVDNSLARQHEGTGLGLALTKRLIELHGGQIFIESQEGQGSTFTIHLPAVSEA